MEFETILATCPLRPGPYPAASGQCAWCGGDLPPRRRRWCSDECSAAVGREHYWTNARGAALKRDRECVRCGATGTWPEAHAWFRLIRGLFPTLDPGTVSPAVSLLIEGERTRRLEVNHKTPVMGRHDVAGCHHHLDGLEVLCRPCHVAETARQFASGEIRRGAA